MVAPPFMTEYEYNTELSYLIVQRIEPRFSCFVSFRDGFTIDQVYNEIAKMNPSANIELHFNSANNPMAYGTETLCDERSVAFAQMIQEAMCQNLGRDIKGNRGVKVLRSGDDRGWLQVSKLNVPSVILEPFFGSNPDDCDLGLRSMEKIADAVSRALDVWFLWDRDGSE